MREDVFNYVSVHDSQHLISISILFREKRMME